MSALQIVYFLSLTDFLQNSHFIPVGNPPPPRPRRPDVFISLITSSGVISRRAFASPW